MKQVWGMILNGTIEFVLTRRISRRHDSWIPSCTPTVEVEVRVRVLGEANKLPHKEPVVGRMVGWRVVVKVSTVCKEVREGTPLFPSSSFFFGYGSGIT